MPCLSRRVSSSLLAVGLVVGLGSAMPALAQGTMTPAATAQMDLRLSALEEEIRSLTGRLEEAQNAADQSQAQLKRLQEDYEFRLNRLEQATGVIPGSTPTAPGASPAPSTTIATPTPAPVPASPAPAPRGTPSPANSSPDALAAYDAALGMLRRGEYLQAEAALKSFLSTYGNDRLAGNAQYWLGETYYARGNYEASAQAFLTGVKTYPDGAKAPDTFLKLGISLVQMGQKDKGCQVLRELPTRYPDAAATIKSRAERGLRDGSCS